MKRPCPICQNSQAQPLYRQSFSQVAEEFPIKGYVVSACAACGFGYADETPEQKEVDRYYKDLSKYEQKHHAGQVSDLALQNYNKIVADIEPFLPSKECYIGDIGCATGALLSVFKAHGYTNLQGIDPSPSCAQTAAAVYNIPVVNSSLFDVEPFERPFDILIFSSVLEHVLDLAGALERVRRLLKPDGLVFIEVPDTINFATWTSAPFQQFSVEHVNFFSPVSLTNLMQQRGFETLSIWHDLRLMGTIKDPSLSAIFRKTEKAEVNLMLDHEAEIALRRYVALSSAKDESVKKKITKLAQNRQPIVIWGTGTQAQRLLATTDLAQANIRAFVDSNSNYQGQKLNGILILSPEQLSTFSDAILISSQVFQEEIADQIRNELRLKNEIIRLFD